MLSSWLCMARHSFQRDGLTLSYLDPGGTGRVLIALHAHIMDATTFAQVALDLAPAWRVIALDQRGHGYSDHAATYTRDDYVRDIEGLVEHLGLGENKIVLLGNSLGGVNAFQFAARHPEKVAGIIVEDIGVEIHDELSFVLPWAGVFASREALAERVGPRMLPYLRESFRTTPDGWKLAFEPGDIVASGKGLLGDHWQDWLASKCPALLLRGRDSRVTTQAELEQMAARRPNTRMKTLDGGHVIHIDNRRGFENAVKEFLETL